MNRLSVVSARAVVTAGVSALLLLGVTTPAAAAVVTLTAQGAGSDEVPAAGGDSVQGTFEIDTDAGTLTYTVSFESDENASAGHIHSGASGANGPVVVPLDPGAIDEAQTATVTVDKALLQAIVANPGSYYLNIHTATFPSGAARGQLVGGAAPTTTSAPSATSSKSGAVSPTTRKKATSPTAVAAGSGGQFAEAQDGRGGVVVLSLGLGLLVIGTAGAVLVRRRNS